jgi:hypothetical protein
MRAQAQVADLGRAQEFLLKAEEYEHRAERFDRRRAALRKMAGKMTATVAARRSEASGAQRTCTCRLGEHAALLHGRIGRAQANRSDNKKAARWAAFP